LVALVYQGVFFHIYGNRSLSYFARMRKSHEKLHFLATHDTLTGVLNARAYYSACEHLIELGRRHGTPFSVLFVDLDHFKSVNDTHGHAAGDIVLKSVANTLRTAIRTSDALGRIGGEEFSIFLPNTDLPGALQLGETIRQAVEQLMPVIESGPLRITASIGVAQCRDRNQTMHDIQHKADEAMYIAKKKGRNRVSSLDTEKSVVKQEEALVA
jgi:diguanylate cyclase (GGDEF)-like protein